jgi:phage anti-repressor protein
MEALIKITERAGKQVVSARALYDFLEVSERFSAWTKRMFKYGFEENMDYVGCKEFNTLANQELEDYALTIECAKEISMLQRSDKGKQARQYFIACEKKLQEAVRPLSQIDMLVQSALLLQQQEQRISTVEEKVRELDTRTLNSPDYYTITGYGLLNGLRLSNEKAVALGKKAAKLCRAKNIAIGSIYEPRYGGVNTYPRAILKEVFNIAC